MNIIVAGVGKTGLTLVRQMLAEGHNITVIDEDNSVLETALGRYDVMAVCGNCASKTVLLQAGVADAELLIAATNADELNLLCCMTAHGISDKLHTIARIRNPEYAEQILTMRDVFPLSLSVNPEKRAAREIQRLLKYPGFLRRDTFAKGRTEIVELRIDSKSKLKDVSLMDMSSIVKCRVLVCAVLRDGAAVAPSGDFVLREGDRIFVTAPTADLAELLDNLNIITRKVRKVLICGGGRVSYYLAKFLEDDRIHVQLMDKDRARCEELAVLLPETEIFHGDCSNPGVLEDQGLGNVDAVVCLTGMDETNILIAMYANSRSVPQIITKVSRGENTMAGSLSLGSVICPKELCSNDILRYVRAMQNQTGAAISVHSIADGQVEAVEFLVDDATRFRDTPLKKLKLKRNVLIASITHGATSQIPNGDSQFTEGDTVVVVTSGRGVLKQINDIFA